MARHARPRKRAPAVGPVVDGSADTVTCTILPGAGEELTAGNYVYDVQIDSGATHVFTLLTGTITVTDDITGADDS